MWVAFFVMLVIIALLMLRVLALGEALRTETRRANREASLRAATEIAFCEVVEEQIGDRLRSNRLRVSETTTRFNKTRSDGQAN